jgi:hypothetical protein
VIEFSRVDPSFVTLFVVRQGNLLNFRLVNAPVAKFLTFQRGMVPLFYLGGLPGGGK